MSQILAAAVVDVTVYSKTLFGDEVLAFELTAVQFVEIQPQEA